MKDKRKKGEERRRGKEKDIEKEKVPGYEQLQYKVNSWFSFELFEIKWEANGAEVIAQQ